MYEPLFPHCTFRTKRCIGWSGHVVLCIPSNTKSTGEAAPVCKHGAWVKQSYVGVLFKELFTSIFNGGCERFVLFQGQEWWMNFWFPCTKLPNSDQVDTCCTCSISLVVMVWVFALVILINLNFWFHLSAFSCPAWISIPNGICLPRDISSCHCRVGGPEQRLSPQQHPRFDSSPWLFSACPISLSTPFPVTK